uniref:Retrovirus-related Pol polyprotein from transposon TNT 1-94 n=1 Tax=Tanacetum cinerariifolium TaxID=118510 RepID=A0A6L2JWI5_TANCI|nr:retrovirus-related Pol polyprotein from transposon TNT 1-94 [Tanacetum cinerariifolium]
MTLLADDGGVTFGIDRPCTYNDLDEHEKKRFDADIRATNIILQGLPKDIYKLINHNTEAKAIWDNVKMVLAGSELTKEDREFQLYDEFERFKMIPGENITDYYVRFHKLVNDMRNIKMTMPNIKLNSNFINNMTLEWDRGDKIRIRGTLLGVQVQLGVADDYDAFNSEVDDEPTTQTIFMANLSSAVSSRQQAGPSNASILSETNVLDSDSADMGNSNVMPYEQYVKHNKESVVPRGASSVQYDDYMMHENSAYVLDDSFTTTLNIYKDQEEIEKMVEGEEDEESYASEFADSMLNDDIDDFGFRIEHGSHKENPDVVDDDVNDKEKQDKKKDVDDKTKEGDVEKMDGVAEEKDNDDHTDHTLVGTHATSSLETKNEQTQTSIPTPCRSPRKDLSSDKRISEELTATV